MFKQWDNSSIRSSAASFTSPSFQILSSVQLSSAPGSPRLLVCILDGLMSPRQRVLWWVDNAQRVLGSEAGPWKKSKEGYSAVSVRNVPAAKQGFPVSSYWCGTIQAGKVFKQKVCSETWIEMLFLLHSGLKDFHIKDILSVHLLENKNVSLRVCGEIKNNRSHKLISISYFLLYMWYKVWKHPAGLTLD